jgi:hypothetical protein
MRDSHGVQAFQVSHRRHHCGVHVQKPEQIMMHFSAFHYDIKDFNNINSRNTQGNTQGNTHGKSLAMQDVKWESKEILVMIPCILSHTI